MGQTVSTALFRMDRFARVMAWLFALWTLGMLAVVIVMRWPSTTDTARIMTVYIDGEPRTGLGFHYPGHAGTALLWTEAIVVAGALLLSILPAVRLRRLGLVILVLWCGLWLGNAAYLSSLGDEDILSWMIPTFALLMLCFGCTVFRTVREWGRARGRSPGEPVEIDVPAA